MNSNQRRFSIIMVSLLVGLIFWIIDGVYDYFSFEETIKELIFHEPLSLWDALLLNVPRDDVIARCSFGLAAILTGFIVILYMERVESDAVRLRKSEQRARLLFENALTGLCSISSGGRLLDANRAFVNLIGFDSEDVEIEDVGDFFSVNIWLSGPFQELVEEARFSREPIVRELTLKDRNDNPIRVLVSMRAVIESTDEHRFELSTLDITARYEAEKIQRLLSRKLVRIQEDERRYFALELHDNLAQDIATLKIGISGILDDEIVKDSPSVANVALCRRIADSLMLKVRSMMHNLKPYELNHVSLDEGIRNYLNNIELDYGISVCYNSSRFSHIDMSLEAKVHLFRIVQAAVANSVQHSGSERLTVYADVTDGQLELSVTDSGKGFNVEEVSKKAVISGRQGIQGMRERANILDVEFRIESTLGYGTTVSVIAPVDKLAD